MKTTILIALLAACAGPRAHRTIESPAAVALDQRLDTVSLHDTEIDQLEAELKALRLRVDALEAAGH